MLNIIKSDLYRTFKGKAIYIVIILMLLMATFSIFGMSPGYIGTATVKEDDEQNQEISQKDIEIMNQLQETNSLTETRKIIKGHFTFELDKQIIGANSNLYYLFIAIVFVVICVDLAGSTAKNTLSSAISRKKYYLSKLITILLLGTALTLINDYYIYFMNIAINGKPFSSDFIDFAKCVLMQYPIILGMLGILVGLAFITRKRSTFNTISIALLIITQLILMGIITLFRIDPAILKWELQNILESLVQNPTNEYIIKTTILGFAYFIGANLIGYYAFKKSEIK